jgi:hypothetical protein
LLACEITKVWELKKESIEIVHVEAVIAASHTPLRKASEYIPANKKDRSCRSSRCSKLHATQTGK